MERHYLSLLLILYGSEIVKGWCYMNGSEPVGCFKGEYCCGSGSAAECCSGAKCCSDVEPDPLPAIIGIIIGVVAGVLLFGGVLCLCKRWCIRR